MEWYARTWITRKQRAELWERWKSGQCVADIAPARALGRRIEAKKMAISAIHAVFGSAAAM